MPYAWYEEVNADQPLGQGDLIDDCPVVKLQFIETSEDVDVAERISSDLQAIDCIVMSQACDLEHGKLREVILCPTYPLSKYPPLWQEAERSRGNNPSPKSWKKHLNEIRDGKIWNLSMIEKRVALEGIGTDIRIVDFHEIFSVPRDFLESWLTQAGSRRLRLLPPYREHLSQAFARYFMRVGLPMEVTTTW